MLLRTRILFYFIFDIKTCLWLTPYIIRVSHPPPPSELRLYGSKLGSLLRIPKIRIAIRIRTLVSHASVCGWVFPLIFIVFTFFPDLRPELFHFRLYNKFNLQLYLFFGHCPPGPNSICCEPRNSIWKYQYECGIIFESHVPSTPIWLLSILWLYANLSATIATPLAPSHLLHLSLKCKKQTRQFVMLNKS